MIPEGYHDLLISTALAHVATIGLRGEPQSTRVWVGWDGEYIRFSQTKPGSSFAYSTEPPASTSS